jgi:hypothetical protein
MTPADVVLRQAFDRHQAASAALRGFEPGTAAALAAHDELRASRIALCEVLEMTGWEPPADVREQVQFDERQLARKRRVPAAA